MYQPYIFECLLFIRWWLSKNVLNNFLQSLLENEYSDAASPYVHGHGRPITIGE